MASLRTDRVRAVALIKNRAGVSNEDTIKQAAARLMERVRAMPLVQKNILKYEITVNVDHRLPTTLAHDLGLKQTEFSSIILIEADSHEKIRETLTSPEYKEMIKGALEHITSLDDYHWFSGETLTVIDK
ncbi:EthD domain-containing protein [Mycena sanguinolenta]|uniref:EthD domain-containing protein n=1 Tax=Mycena sanguinolenta TaxID=230812 RepID=A0A8H6ZCH5_9AGAR|nr:EthD domain-containing protein [Mycena sanguinolenta]